MEFPQVISADRASRMHNPGSMGTWLESHRVIDSETVCSCDPNGRGLDAQPWIHAPEVCTTMDPRAGSMHNPGFKASSMQTSANIGRRSASQGQQYVNIRRTSANQGQQLRFPAGRLVVVIHGDLVGVPSSDQRRPGQQNAQPWIHGDLVGVRSSEVLRASLQLRAGTRCSPLD